MKETIKFNEAYRIYQDALKKEQEAKKEFEEVWENCKNEVLDRIYDCNKPFSYSDIKDIMSSWGLEMDYI